MIICYTGETPPDSFASSIFLAGPSPRDAADPNWRPEALETLERLGFEGVVFAPIYRGKPTVPFDYDKQVEWEKKWLNASDLIVFWVPRDLKKLPGFTTNVEYGMWLRSGKVLLGSPEDADKMQYLEWWADQEGVPNYHDLDELLEAAVKRLGEGSMRAGGEREVPLHLWVKPEFQTWLSLQKAQGNRLDGAQVVWTFRVGKNKETAFLWALHVDVWIASEKRSKTNEVAIFRPDISSIVVYCRPPNRTGWDWLLDTEIVLVDEFRSPVANNLGMVREVPGGSSTKPGIEPGTLAAKELEEETGLAISEDRFKFVGLRQVASTLSAHRAHVFAVELTQDEMLTLRWGDSAHGNHDESEYTFTRVMSVVELLGEQSMDWSNLGMFLQALLTAPAPDNL